MGVGLGRAWLWARMGACTWCWAVLTSAAWLVSPIEGGVSSRGSDLEVGWGTEEVVAPRLPCLEALCCVYPSRAPAG